MQQVNGGRFLSDAEWDEKVAQANQQRADAAQQHLVDEAARRAAENAAQGVEENMRAEAPNPSPGAVAGAQAAAQVAPAVGARVGAQMAAISPERRAFATGLTVGVVVGGIAVMALRRADQGGGASE